MLAVAEAFKKSGARPERTLRFVFFDGEEVGILGSPVHFDHSIKANEDVKLFINIDMIGYNPGGGDFATYDATHAPRILPLLNRVNEVSGLNFEMDSWNGFESDNMPAERRGIPTLSLFEDPRDENGKEMDYDPHNHKKTDRSQRLNFPYANKMTQLIGAMTLAASTSDEQWGSTKGNERQKKAAKRVDRRIKSVTIQNNSIPGSQVYKTPFGCVADLGKISG